MGCTNARWGALSAADGEEGMMAEVVAEEESGFGGVALFEGGEDLLVFG